MPVMTTRLRFELEFEVNDVGCAILDVLLMAKPIWPHDASSIFYFSWLAQGLAGWPIC
jgi:hypothetical protein